MNENIVQRVKDANNIFDIVSQHISLKRTGMNFNGVCPFHDDKSPSLSVSTARQTFRCWACGEHGDVITFVQKIEHIEFPEALRQLAKKANIEIEEKELTPEDRQKILDREAQFTTIEAAALYYQKNISQAADALQKRGYNITDQVITDFRIGYAPTGNTLLSDLTASGYSIEKLIQIDVVKKGEKGNYDTFRDRIQFPFIDMNGRVTGFSGRIINPAEKIAKYINTGETPIYTKGKNIFGLYQARQEIARLQNAYLVEGQFDVTSFHMYGIKNTIGGSGTALTPDQIKLIGRFTRTVTLVYDADKAGTKAALKNCESFLLEGFTVRFVSLPESTDPDNLAQEKKEKLGEWLTKNTIDFIAYFYNSAKINKTDPDAMSAALSSISELIASVPEDIKRNEYIRRCCTLFEVKDQTQAITSKVKEIRSSKSGTYKKTDIMKAGIYGLDELKEGLKNQFNEHDPIIATSKFEDFLNDHSESPCIYIHQQATTTSIQELRSIAQSIYLKHKELDLNGTRENDFLSSIVNIYKLGLTDITVFEPEKAFKTEQSDDQEEDPDDQDDSDIEISFLSWYIQFYSRQIYKNEKFKSHFISRCAELLSFAPESERYVYISDFAKQLSIPKGSLDAILKPLVEKKKNKQKIELQRDDNALEVLDGSSIPDYVEENDKYKKMYANYQYFPYLNSKGEPVAYVFKDKSGHIIVGDFYLEPLLHIYHKDPELNRRIFKVNRRFYVKPFFMEFKSNALLLKTTFESVIINEEAMNFDNATNEHWTKIRSCMSHHYTTVSEINVYGQQPEDFFAFSNAIFHKVDGRYQIDLSTELGVTTHMEKNYYHPASSVINRSLTSDDDRYEIIRQLKFDGKQISNPDEPLIAIHENDQFTTQRHDRFATWADLMDRVYNINDNGKWATIYAIMCAFRSDIHAIDRFFTAIFFMGPTMSGKTQIAISIRSLYISPLQPAFNLNTGTDAAMSTLMGTFRDVPVVLEEYNNKEISDNKFQALKAITYDGDAKQKRKGTSGKDIESDKIYAPVAICGQETPQRDDNALMNRIIVCEVPKKGIFTEEAKALFQTLKQMEKEGLSDILFEVLQLRPLIRQHFRNYSKEISKQLMEEVLIGSNSSGDMVRIINTITLFLTLCKIITTHATHLKLPFTYDQFFTIASEKVISQVEMISHTDKLANFFKAMDVMLDSGVVKRGRDFDIKTPKQITFKLPGNEKKVENYDSQKKILFLRISNLFICYTRNYNTESVTQSTLEQNLRSHPAYLGITDAQRFEWLEEKSVPAGDSIKMVDGVEVKSKDMSMRKIMEKQSKVTSCLALDYEVFLRFYEDLDLERRTPKTDQAPDQPNPEDNTQEMPPF